jgi:hypothetical protein
VYVAAQDGIVHALNAVTGADVAPPFATGSRIFLSSPAISNGVGYIGNIAGRLFAFA